MFGDTITKEDQKQLEDSKPLYSIPSNESITHYMKIYLYRYLHKDTENFEQIWRVNGTVPQRDQYFYQQFPKKATSLDSEHHYSNFNMYGYCSRWLPAPILNFLFPFQSLIYDSDGNSIRHQQAVNDDNDNKKIKRKLTAKGVPTSIECAYCEHFNGVGVWDRKGNWSCTKRDSGLDLYEQDEMGLKFFVTFNQYCAWKKILNDKIEKCYTNDEDDQVIVLENFKNHSHIPKEIIVEH